jgi:pimeloyl-ACP methyl ester carboxylesterase
MAARRLVEESAVLVEGPWTHRDVAANGIRLHVAQAGPDRTGERPLVVLLHGFPEFWWSWRYQLTDLAAAGFRVVAPDLRGYGASDKPPRGYDAPTLAADIAGLIRALGERTATIVGHDWGGHLAWTLAALHPSLVERIVVVSAPHPLRWLPAFAAGPQRRASRYMARFQLPWHPERWLVDDDAVNVARLLRDWGGAGFPDAETERRCRDAMQILAAPHCALEYYRWAVRSVPRGDGRRFRTAMARPIPVPVLHLHGELDRCVLPATAAGSGRHVSGDYRWQLLAGAGHFPHQEHPADVTAAILEWCEQ